MGNHKYSFKNTHTQDLDRIVVYYIAIWFVNRCGVSQRYVTS